MIVANPHARRTLDCEVTMHPRTVATAEAPRAPPPTRDSGPLRSFVVIGAGPAGLAAAHELVRLGERPLVLEKGNTVGGLARTESYQGYRFDMGGHRFFTKSSEVNALWHDVLGDDFLKRGRLSRIYYRGRFFHYPLKAVDTLRGLGVIEACLILLSYLRRQALPHPREESLEEWVSNRFGDRLFRTFFKTYTEKVWGVPCRELKAEWAAQRIKGLSLKTLLLRPLGLSTSVTTLIEEFHYPRLGPGMMWQAFKTRIEERGGRVTLGATVARIRRAGSAITSIVLATPAGEEVVHGTHFISSMPVSELIAKLDPPPPAEVVDAARGLRYRGFLTVGLIVAKPRLFPDNWIYVHEPDVQVARIQNFKNWSPDMVPDPAKTSLGLEYFCDEGDPLWIAADDDLIALARRELEAIGVAQADDVLGGCVFRVPRAYPVYDSSHAAHLDTVRRFVDSLTNCQTVGRNGLHRYNNQDHSMLTGIYAARNAAKGDQSDLWSVNTELEYHEEMRALDAFVARIDPMAAGVAVGLVTAVMLMLVTLFMAWQGAPSAAPSVALLGQLLPGYEPTIPGAFAGVVWAGLFGFLAGWSGSSIRNASLYLYLAFVRGSLRLSGWRRLLEFM
jgi:protoporphyrinogen oxidase